MNQHPAIAKLNKVITIAGTAVLMNVLFVACWLLYPALGLSLAFYIPNKLLQKIALAVSFLPAVLGGQAWCGLFTAVRYNIRGEKWFDGFKTGFKKRFLRGTVAWTLMLALDVYMLFDVEYALQKGYTVQLVPAALIMTLAMMATSALVIRNVYVPTKLGDWLEASLTMVFKAPLQLLAAAVLMWAPIVLAVLRIDYFIYAIMIFLAAYFAAVTLFATMIMKEPLVEALQEARENGTLLAEEGKGREEGKKDSDGQV